MVTGAGLLSLKDRLDAEGHGHGSNAEAQLETAGLRVQVSSSIADVEAEWRQLEAVGLQSPSQSFDFNRIWIETLEIRAEERLFVSVTHNDWPVMVLALKRCKLWASRLVCPLSGRHVGTNSPLIDKDRLALCTPEQRAQINRQILARLDADLVVLPHVLSEDVPYLAAGGLEVDSEHLYRAQFESWAQCDSEQRSRSRRKHDKQQGAKLAALGEVEFEEISGPADVSVALDALFRDRAARFDGLGIADPFAPPKIRAFYRTMFDQSGVLRGVVHVLRVNGEIAATRYSLAAGDKMFCLISGMNTSAEMLPGSPGKQILVHIMRHVFDNGTRTFDLGAGFSDEKRHWCNQRLPLCNVYLPISFKGKLLAMMLVGLAKLKAKIKSNPRLFATLKQWRARLAKRAQTEA